MEYLRKMKKLFKNKEFIFVILFIVLASLLRLLWLDKVPTAIGGDELTYVMNAKAMFLSGSDISGTWNPLSIFLFHYPAYTTPQAELPYFLLAPVVGLFSFSLFSAKITFALLSIFSVFLIYLIAKQLFGREVGIIAGFIAAINPWLIYIGRTDYEGSPAVFFFLLGLLILLKAKSWKILWAIPFLFLAFYSYIGTKLAFLPFVLLSCFYAYWVVNKKQFFKQYLLVFLASFALIAFFIASSVFASGPSRIGEVFTPNDPTLAKQVDAIRKVSIQNPLTDVFENKFTMYGRVILTKLFKSFAADYLFVYGDNFFSILRNGMFYVLDAFFLLIGIAGAYAGKRKEFWFLLSIIFISTFPQILHTADLGNMVFHLSLMFPFLIILIAVGIWEIVKIFKNKWYFYASSAIVILLYTFLLLNFLNIYFYQWTLQGYFDFHVRLFSKYVTLAKQNNQQVLIYSPSAPDIFKKYLFYSNSYNKDTYLQIRKIYAANKFTFQNLKFMGCDNTIDPSKTNDVIIYDFNCGALKQSYPRVVIPRLSDGGQSYDIFNDKICSQYNLGRYPTNLSISDFSIESQSAQKFCQTYITNP
jgi:4-amino-4-deoxy-L-arabinose transferase-like glycosyltransferase